MTALRDTPARITLRNAPWPERPLGIDGPIAIVAELDGTQSSSPIEAQRVLVARALHQLISEQFPTSTLRFVVDDVPTFGGFDAAVSAERELQWISYCGRLSVPPPDPSLRTSLIREQRELALLEMIEAKTLVCVQRFGDYETFDVNRTLWAQRSGERRWALPATIPLYDNGRVGGRNPSGWAIWGSFTAVELCTIALNDGLPIVLLSHTNNFVDPLAVSAIAELRDFSQPIACIPSRSERSRTPTTPPSSTRSCASATRGSSGTGFCVAIRGASTWRGSFAIAGTRITFGSAVSARRA